MSTLGADAVAMAVDPDTIASTDVDVAFGLTAEQRKQIDALYYEDGHFVGASKLWSLASKGSEDEVDAEASDNPVFEKDDSK